MWALRGAGHRIRGGTMSITSDVEMGSGVSSSAALECAVLGALATAADLRIDRIELARIAQRAENDYVGAPTGMMDQLASLCGEPRKALMIDFREPTVRPVAFDPDASDVALLLINSRAPHQHAGGEYASRRSSCERAASRPRRVVTAGGAGPRRGGSRRGDRPGRCASGPAHPDRQPARARCRCGAGGVGLHRDRHALQRIAGVHA